MAERNIPSVAADFAAVLTFMKDRGIIPATPPSPLVDCAKRIHRSTYSLILWRFRLNRLKEHGQVFIEEIASDALQILPQVLMGYGKTAKLLMRGIIENTLRHVYFSDHPVEFSWMNLRSKWYISTEDLLDYARSHPIFQDCQHRFDAVNILSTLYNKLSADIHGRKVQDLEMRIALKKIEYVEENSREEAKLIEKCTAAANFLLAMFHCEQMSSFQLEDRRIILRTMPPQARKVWTEYS